MGSFLLSVFSPETLSWVGFIVLALALVGEAGIWLIPKKREAIHAEVAFIFAILAAGGYAIERVGDDAIVEAAKAAAAQANTSLRKAERDIAALRSQTVARRVSPEQKAALVSVLSPFAGQKVTIMCTNSAWDCFNFGADFQGVFREAKWETPNEIGVGIPLGLDPIGVEFAINPAWKSDPPPAALNALGIAMVRLGFAREPVSVATIPTVPVGAIEFRIGRIPPPP